MVRNEEIFIKYIVTEYMLAGLLIEGFRPIVFMKYVENMGIVKSFDVFG